MSGLRIPTSTYRLQFHQGFTFRDGEQVVSYLERLGVTDVYSSPPLQARSGSLHGYDVTNHSVLNPELGGEEAFVPFSDALRQRDMGLIVDIVPNHMEIDDPANQWWQDVLENGPSSSFAEFFDIDWSPPKHGLRNRVSLPVLGDQFGKVLENGEITLFYEAGGFFVAYYDHRFPIDPHTASGVLSEVVEHVRFTTDPEDPHLTELESIVTSLKHLPERTTTDPDELEERRREKEVAKQRLARLVDDSPTVRRAIEGVVVEWCGRKGEPETFDRLEELLMEQAYRLSHWRVAADEINYRRFFDINDLAAIRVEVPHVFHAVHEVVLRLTGEGRVQGLRIDHPDGLYDPEQYFLALQSECRRLMPSEEGGATRFSVSSSDTAIYIVAEKILSHNEQLPASWAVHGTTGYEILNLINGLFIDPQAQQPLYDFYKPLWQRPINCDDLVYECKKVILDVSMSSELHVLARRLDRLSEQHRWSRDFTLWSLHDALGEVIACFPVYRTYVKGDSVDVSEEERRQVEAAIRGARRRNPATDESVFDFIKSVLLLQEPEGLTAEQRTDRREFVMKLQQLTGPVMAKGLEDTAFYRVYPLASINEVGGEPHRFGVSIEEFHRTNTVRCGRWPYGMTASSTHDSKRSEDVRAWLNALSEIPDQWIESVERWFQMNQARKPAIDEQPAPDLNEEYLLYQTLVGTWPLEPMSEDQHEEYVDRIAAYMDKALREAKIHTSWVNPKTEYDQAVAKFVRATLNRDENDEFLQEAAEFRERINLPGMCNALAQLVLKVTVPGVPDFYQGSELWNFSLVDPDNRRPVDYAQREYWLRELQEWEGGGLEPLVDELLAHWKDGRIKLFTTYRSLNFRKHQGELFLDGDYQQVEVEGPHAQHICAFLRRSSSKSALVVVPRWPIRLAGSERLPLGGDVWKHTALLLPKKEPPRWRNIFTGAEHHVDGRKLWCADLLQRFPVAIFESL